MSFNRGKVIAVDPKTQKKPNPWAKDIVVNFDQRNNLMPNTMNIPEGYRMMPDGTIMANDMMEYAMGGMPCYECGGGIPHMKAGGNWMANIKSTGQCTGSNFGGPNCRPGTREYAFAKRARSGEFNKQFGGDAQAPQNTTIDSIGKTKTDLMKNYLAANTMGAMLDQESQRLTDEMQQYFAEGGSIYNPNLYGAQQYASAVDATRNQFKKDWKKFSNAMQQAGAGMRKKPQARVPQSNGEPLTFSPESMDAMPNRGFGSNQPDTFGRNVDQSFGQGQPTNWDFAYGGEYLPMAQYGIPENVRPLTPEELTAGSRNIIHIPGVTRTPTELEIMMGTAGTSDWNAIEQQRAADANRFPMYGTIPMRASTTSVAGFPTGVTAADDPTIAKPVVGRGTKKTKTISADKAEFDKMMKDAEVSNAVKKKATQSKKGATPAVRKEIEEAERKVAAADRAKAAIRVGNYKETPSVAGRMRSPYAPDMGYSTVQGVMPGYGGGRMKIKGVDPETGKRFKIKYDTAQSPRDYYGRRGPRVVKYDIYNNPVFQQQGAPGTVPAPAPELPVTDENGNVVNN
ncbi:hypothetical protein KAR91_26730, partial [Candidatus Pacearchaeota archaeon]|nr:hypothetical protein [Candidatus Pacearchaeota archaeon]